MFIINMLRMKLTIVNLLRIKPHFNICSFIYGTYKIVQMYVFVTMLLMYDEYFLQQTSMQSFVII